MNVKTRMLSLAMTCTALSFMGGAAFAATERCTVNTARQSVSTETLCSCGVVQDRMLRYLQRRADFEDILARTSQSCPAFAAVLTDYPTASIASNLFGRGEDRDGSNDRSSGNFGNTGNDQLADGGNSGGDGGGGNSGDGNSGGGNSGGGNSGGPGNGNGNNGNPGNGGGNNNGDGPGTGNGGNNNGQGGGSGNGGGGHGNGGDKGGHGKGGDKGGHGKGGDKGGHGKGGDKGGKNR
ncbi:hypothetical protein M3P21_01340 [Ruegeria sp. 2012CJ41-6]|uniref:Uncharacterized protein n=1 Tax=Ruegeria spongiae TaxID=2942209 RepID=A0ABT0PX21_9RHOB|nr:hypothetical protein [Ruegeria spongiae]MCL6282160.1 hypothetical protein [Ruegeria spongiae]